MIGEDQSHKVTFFVNLQSFLNWEILEKKNHIYLVWESVCNVCEHPELQGVLQRERHQQAGAGVYQASQWDYLWFWSGKYIFTFYCYFITLAIPNWERGCDPPPPQTLHIRY